MIDSIISGWRNFIDKSEVTEKVAMKRASICAQCEYAKKGKLLLFLKDSLSEIEGMYCSDCGCPLSPKVRSNDNCPNDKW
ncbi:MAG: hypothetical protein EOO45_21810 [Flavobacterium sp.]|nr:MAG: hypothetical protein EOO45_21810 [Flavobacterium sp.]